MKNRKRLIAAFLSAALLFAGYVLTRYVLFDLHGMKQWPLTLLVIGGLVAGVAWLLKARLTPWITSAGYTLSFLIGALLQTDSIDASGTATNNLWIIWTGIYLMFVLAGIIADLTGQFGRHSDSTVD